MSKRWYTLNIRLATDEPIEGARIAAKPRAPGYDLAPVIREALCIEGTVWLEDVSLIPDPIARSK